MKISKEVETLLTDMALLAEKFQHEYVTPEHLLYMMTYRPVFVDSFCECGGNVEKLRENLEQYFEENITSIKNKKTTLSSGLNKVLLEAEQGANASERVVVEISHLVAGIMKSKESYAAYYVQSQGVIAADLLSAINMRLLEQTKETDKKRQEKLQEKEEQKEASWKEYVTCYNDQIEQFMPLIGREKELERTIQILCRKLKNNPLHIGEAGVGKTAITIGLAQLLNKNKVPDKLKGAKIYAMDMASMLAGTQFRGDFEKRFKKVMDGLSKEEKPIVYLDEIHTLVGAGAINGGAMDASNMLKPYLSQGHIRFIGATTYEEYKKYFSKNKSLMRRFQNVEIIEPSVEECSAILKGLKRYYEKFHGVRYSKGTIEHAVYLADKYIKERFLPDKAIDLIDEAGAYRILHPTDKKIQTVDKKLVEHVVSEICHLPETTVESDEIQQLSHLEENISKRVFGQQEAVTELVNAVKFARAGLNEEEKPLANILFVGPTGVGKTESAKALAELLKIDFIRFDMSEYAEKHTVAKLIGSPAGYVGYEDGGLLTESIRKHPHAVLLLDEIEKAHSDIFNILLQVMDYATLTDNQGRKADFRNVILIMTSNTGAGKVGKKLVGFGERSISREIILEDVKKTFTPEFRNRLNKTIVFHEIDDAMAMKIVTKQLKLLENKLESKKIQLEVSEQCITYLKEQGISQEYGAREISRVIDREIKPLLADKILFGNLKHGGKCYIDYKRGKISLTTRK